MFGEIANKNLCMLLVIPTVFYPKVNEPIRLLHLIESHWLMRVNFHMLNQLMGHRQKHNVNFGH